MIPILYSKTETAFTSNGLGRLADASKCEVTEERNGIFEMEMEYPMTGVHFKEIQPDCYIKAFCNAKKEYQLFRVYSITKPINGRCTVFAEHVSYQMLHIPLMPFTAVGASGVMAAIPQNVIGDCPFTFWTDIVSTRRYNLQYPKSLRGALQGDQWSILQNYGGDYEWDNWTVRLWAQRGQDKGVILRYGKNIVDLKQEENIQNTYTGIVPYWYGAEGEDQTLVTLPERVLYADTASSFPYSRILAVDFTEQMETKPTVEELRAQGLYYIERNEIGYPSISISLDFIDLSQTVEYQDLAVETLNICDVITVEFEELGISKKARITRTKYDVLTERYTDLYIGESYHSLASIIADQKVAAGEVVVSTRDRIQSALDEATAVINGDIEGSSMKTITDQYGNPRGLIIMDTYNESTAVNCIRINNNGIGFSTNGPNGPYNSAWLINGTFDASEINVINLTASMIQGGTLTLGGNNNEEGVLIVKNSSGQQIGKWDKDGIAVNSGSIAVGVITGSVSNNSGWVLDFTNGSFSTGNISANNITSGSLTIGGSTGNTNGSIIVKDANNNTIGSWSKDGITLNKGSIDASKVSVTNISASNISSGSMSVDKITGNITNGNWKVDFTNGTFSIGNISAANINTGYLNAERIEGGTLSVQKLTGSISNGNWKLDFDANNGAGSFTVGNISANNITTGTLSADRIASRSLSADKISGGSLILGGANNASGTLTIKDASNNTIGTWNKDGISITKGSIAGPSITLGGANNGKGTISIQNSSNVETATFNNDGFVIRNSADNIHLQLRNDTNPVLGLYQYSYRPGDTGGSSYWNELWKLETSAFAADVKSMTVKAGSQWAYIQYYGKAKGGSWIAGRDNAFIKVKVPEYGPSSSLFIPFGNIETSGGSWSIGTLVASSADALYFVYGTNANWSGGINTTSQIYFRPDGTSNIGADKDGAGNTITSTYVKKAGDTMSGALTVSSGNIQASEGNIYSGTTASNAARNVVARNANGYIAMQVAANGTRGLYDSTNSTWMLYRQGSSNNVYVVGDVAKTSKNTGYWLMDKNDNRYAGIHDNGSNLWIGANAGGDSGGIRHHAGQTFISAGWDSANNVGYSTINISVPNAYSATGHSSYNVIHSGNFESRFKTVVKTPSATPNIAANSAGDVTINLTESGYTFMGIVGYTTKSSYVYPAVMRAGFGATGNITITLRNTSTSAYTSKPEFTCLYVKANGSS